MSTAAVTTARPVMLTREGSVFRLAFRFDLRILQAVKTLPFATFDPSSKTWTAAVCAQSVQTLRRFFYEGLTDVPVDSLLAPGEDPPPCRPAELRAGTGKRPFYVHLAMREDNTFNRVRSIAGAQWEKKAQALSFPPHASVALAELVDRGVIADPAGLLTPAGTVVAFDARTGQFVVRGEDRRAAAAFDKHFPHTDIVAAWQRRGLDVAFNDEFTAEIYRGELARLGPGHQPEGFGVELYDFQKRNVAAALERTGFAIFDGPGLGKSAQAIAVGFEHLRAGRITRTIVIAPAAVRSQWAGEIMRFTGCGPEDVAVVTGTPKKRAAAYEQAKTAKWLIVHYDVLTRDQKKLKPLFAGALVVADEAHRLKNWKAQRTVAALSLCLPAARRIALTGTPTEREAAEWYQVLSGFTVPGCLGAPEDFNGRYRYKSKFGYEGSRNIPELRERSRVYYGRHTKEQVAKHLPPLRVQQAILDPEAGYAAALRRAHREAADEIKTAALARLDRGHAGAVLRDQSAEDEVETGAEMTAVGMLRLLCSSPRLVAESDSEAAAAMRAAGIVPDEDGPKLDELRVMLAEMKAAQQQRKDRMEEEGITEATPEMVHGERVVVFTFSRHMADLICTRLSEDGVSHVKFTGSSNSRERDAAVAAFTDPNSDVIAFIATDAAAEGLNLGRCCSTLIQFDPAWTPSRAIQRMNRIHRLDGTAPRYLVINFVLANTLEIGMARLLGERADLSDALFGESGGRYQATGRRSRGTGRSVFELAMDQFHGDVTKPAKKSKSTAPAATTAPGPAARPKTAAKKARPAQPGEYVPIPEEPPVLDEEAPFPDEEAPFPDEAPTRGDVSLPRELAPPASASEEPADSPSFGEDPSTGQYTLVL